MALLKSRIAAAMIYKIIDRVSSKLINELIDEKILISIFH